jgi:hypothetical protein
MRRRRVRERLDPVLSTVTLLSDIRGAAALLVSSLQVVRTVVAGRRWSKPACTADRCIRSVSTKLLAVVPTR